MSAGPRVLPFLVFLVTAAACGRAPAGPPGDGKAPAAVPAELTARVAKGELRDAVLAGGCFWCIEGTLEKHDGVVAAISGYSGGGEKAPSYEQVGSGQTGHTESVLVFYDPKKLSYEELLRVFWRNIDPMQANGQFCDHGPQYRSAIFFANAEEKAAAERTRAELAKLPTITAPIVTELAPRGPFHPAEGYHQDYYKTNEGHYRRYREGCGRDRRLEALFGP